MHQTFYIDADEEISSVIDRLNRSMSSVNYFVVPKRAIFLLSIINLKLLKSESEKLGKKLVIVTQDEAGASMAERSGLEVRRTIDDIELGQQVPISHPEDVIEEDVVMEDQEDFSDELQDKKIRLKNVGTNSFYAEKDESEKKIAKSSRKEDVQVRKVKVNGAFDMRSEAKNSRRATPINSLHGSPGHGAVGVSRRSQIEETVDSDKVKILEKMYSSVKNKQKSVDAEKVHMVSGSSKKIFLSFIFLCLVLFVSVAAYLFLPSAKVTIIQSEINEKVDVVIQGSLEPSVDAQNNIEIRILEEEKELTLSYDVKGGQGVSGKKAHGSVAIYNEFSNSPQTLVSTTRLESVDGKIFRLVKNVVVPGTTLIGGETKPGVIEAEVVADQAGEDFNLQPTSFKIPGFKDGPKYDKFIAKSTENFVGGSVDEGGTSSGLLTQSDLDNAKQQTEKAVGEELKKNIKDKLVEGEMVLDQAEKISILKSSTKTKVGNAVDKFDYVVSAKIKTLVFVENAVKKILIQEFKKKHGGDVKFEISKLEYGLSVADFEKNTLELKIRGDFSIIADIDTEKIKRELLGKRDDQIDEVFKNNKNIKNANVEFSIPFISQIPQYSSRVSVEIGKESQE